MRILIAPDKFKDALDAQGVAEAIAAGIREAQPNATITLLPLGDGGEGTGAILAQHCGATPRHAEVLDPLGRPRNARWWRDEHGDEAIIELAQAAGLALLAPSERDATAATTYSVGQLIRAAVDEGCKRITLCVGGSATVDGGAGCLQALGWQFRDAANRLLEPPITGGKLIDAASITPPKSRLSIAVRILCDVRNPLLGERGAARVFAPQKGANHAQVEALERGLEHWASILKQVTQCNVRTMEGAGAAGGLPAGLHAAFGATLVNGFDEVAQRVGLQAAIEQADLIITGEGRMDEQTREGKVVSGVATLASTAGRRAFALVGQCADPTIAKSIGLTAAIAITPPSTPLDQAITETAANLRRSAAQLAKQWT